MARRKASKGTSQGAEMWNELSISMNKNGFCQSVYSHPIKITEGRFCKWINCLFKMFIHFCEQPFSRLGPINTLIWMDQINGIGLLHHQPDLLHSQLGAVQLDAGRPLLHVQPLNGVRLHHRLVRLELLHCHIQSSLHQSSQVK